MARSDIFNALLALAENCGIAFVDTGRRLKEWDQCQKPALYQIEPAEVYRASEGRLRIRTLKATWVIYHDAGADPNAVPVTETDAILDALDTMFPDQNGPDKQTLGGLVHCAFIDGQVQKFEGDLDGKTVITLPLSILIP